MSGYQEMDNDIRQMMLNQIEEKKALLPEPQLALLAKIESQLEARFPKGLPVAELRHTLALINRTLTRPTK